MLFGDLAQPLEIALGRRQTTGRTCHRLDDDGGDGRGIVQTDQPLEFVGEMAAPLRLASTESLLGAVVGRGQVIDASQHVAEHLAVGDHAADRDAAEADAVVAAFAPDETGTTALAAAAVVGQRHLQRGIDRLAARVGIEHVVEVARCHQGELRRQLELLWMAVLEWRCEVERGGSFLNRLDDRLAGMAGVDAEQSGRPVDYLAPVGRQIVHVLGAGEQAWTLLERTVRGEWKPV